MVNLGPELESLQNATGISDFFRFANSVTTVGGGAGIFTGMMLLAIFFIMVLGLKRYGLDNGLLTASWTCFLLSLLLRSADLISIMFVLGFLAITAIITAYKIIVKPSPY
jgi:hypothetical protein